MVALSVWWRVVWRAYSTAGWRVWHSDVTMAACLAWQKDVLRAELKGHCLECYLVVQLAVQKVEQWARSMAVQTAALRVALKGVQKVAGLDGSTAVYSAGRTAV